MGKCFKQFFNGLFKENPTFVLMLGMCPTLAVTSSASNGLGMGLTTTAVLALSNLFISLIRKVIPNKVRIPAFIVVVATFVTTTSLNRLLKSGCTFSVGNTSKNSFCILLTPMYQFVSESL